MALALILPLTPKRQREVDERETHLAAKFLISNQKYRVFTCRTCNKEFSSPQALGGHSAGHNNRSKIKTDMTPGSVSIKLHTCSFCFKTFVSGQALGGHMRKHREAMEEKAKPDSPNRKIVVSGNHKEDKIMVLGTDPIVQEKCSCGSIPVTRDYFPRNPVWVEKVPVKIVPVLGEDEAWLELTVGPSWYYRKD